MRRTVKTLVIRLQIWRRFHVPEHGRRQWHESPSGRRHGMVMHSPDGCRDDSMIWKRAIDEWKVDRRAPRSRGKPSGHHAAFCPIAMPYRSSSLKRTTSIPARRQAWSSGHHDEVNPARAGRHNERYIPADMYSGNLRQAARAIGPPPMMGPDPAALPFYDPVPALTRWGLTMGLALDDRVFFQTDAVTAGSACVPLFFQIVLNRCGHGLTFRKTDKGVLVRKDTITRCFYYTKIIFT